MSQQPLEELMAIIDELREQLGERAHGRLKAAMGRVQAAWTAKEEQAHQVEYVAVVTDPDDIPDLESDDLAIPSPDLNIPDEMEVEEIEEEQEPREAQEGAFAERPTVQIKAAPPLTEPEPAPSVAADEDEDLDVEVDVDLAELSAPMGEMMPELQVSTREVPKQQLVELLPETDMEETSKLNAEEFLKRINSQVENFARDLKVSPRVLVVEDDPESQEQLVDRMSQHEILADLAMSGEEAIDRLSDKAYAVCVVGQRLPDVSGDELVQRIRDGWPLMEVLACVPADNVARAESAMQAGASDYLPVPYPSSHYLNMKIRLSQARHDFETRVNAVIQHLSRTMSRLAKERGPKVLNSYIQSLKRTLESYEENAPELRIVVLGTPQLLKAAGSLGHQVLEVKTGKEIEDMVRMGMAQVVVAVDNPGKADGVELMYRLRQVSPTVGIFVVSTEMRLQSLVEAVGTTIGDFLLRPLEGRELFLPRLKKLIERQKQMTRYRLLLEELKVMNINLMNPVENI